MTTSPLESSDLDHAAASRWPRRAAADVLGLGMVLAVLVALPAAPSDLDRHQLPKESVMHLATWMAVVLARPNLTRGLSRATLLGLTLFLTLSLTSAIFATNPWIALRAVGLTCTGIAAFTTARALAEQGFGDRLLRWMGVAAGVGVATALAQAYGAHSVLFAATRAPGGTFGNRNFMAHFSALALPVLVTLTLTTRNRVAAISAAFVVGGLTIGIVLSRSRTAWVGVPCGMAAYLSLMVPSWRHRAVPVVRSRAVLLLASVMLGLIGALTLPNSLHWREDDSQSPYVKTLTGLVNSKEGSGRGRLIQYRNTLKLAAEHPLLGVGPGNWPIRYGDVAPPNDPSWAYNDPVPLNPWPSSDWMALVSERGIAAVLAILLVGGSCLWRALQGVRSGGTRGMAAATLGAVVVIAAVEGVFDAILLLPAPLMFVAIACGTLLSGSEHTIAPGLGEAPSSRWAFAVAALLGVIVVRSGSQTAAYMVAGTGRSLSRLEWAARIDPTSYPIRIALAVRAPCSSARDDARAALRLAPGWPAPRVAVRRCGG
jgi:O-antigen ligase